MPSGGVLAALLLVAAEASQGAGSAPRAAFAPCEDAVVRAPEAYASYLCYYQAGQASQSLAEAAQRLEALEAERRGGGWALLVRAHVAYARQEGPATSELYRRAAERFATEGEPLGEVLARANLHRLYLVQDDRADAEAQVERARRLADASGNREVRARAAILEATHQIALGRDLGGAHRTLLRAEADAFPEGDAGLQQAILEQLGNVAFHLGRYEEAVAALERLLALQLRLGVTAGLASRRFNIANARCAQGEARPGPRAREELTALVEATLRSAEEEGNTSIAVRAHALLGDLLSRYEPARAADHHRRCLQAARALEQGLPEMECLRSIAQHLAPTRPREAERALDRAAGIAAATRNNMYAAYVWEARAHTVWETQPRAAAAAASLQALDAIEGLRAAQADQQARIEVAANWTATYHFLAGRLLSADAPDLALAFGISERMRARALLEALAAAGIAAHVPGPDSPTVDRTRVEIAAVQRRLRDPSLPASARQALVEELRRLELEEEEGRAKAFGPRAAQAMAPDSLATLEQVQRALRPDEALLVFLVGLERDLYDRFGGGSWALMVTASGAVAWPIPDRLRLEVTVPVFAGLLDRRDDAAAAPAATALHRQLLGELAGPRGAGIRRLLVVPDGVLYQLPFEALRAAPDAPPLGSRYEVALVPSATLWARWRAQGAVPVPPAALVLADPELAMGSAAASERGGFVAAGIDLGRLPRARHEGARVRRAIGGESRLLVGGAATEAAVKAAALDRFGILHFATHALADEAYPDRAAVVLGAGSSQEDGLLQPPEASVLALDGRAVVLSGCRTAAGPVAGGEGVLSLARSFFQAGARTVVASRWQLRDDEAERLFSTFYGHLGRGLTVGESLRLARGQAAAEGMPAAGWAGLVLLGDPGFALAPRAPAPRWPAALWLGAVAVALGLLGWATWRALRRSRAS